MNKSTQTAHLSVLIRTLEIGTFENVARHIVNLMKTSFREEFFNSPLLYSKPERLPAFVGFSYLVYVLQLTCPVQDRLEDVVEYY